MPSIAAHAHSLHSLSTRAQILQACGKRAEAFASCMEFLSEHGESIPDFTDANKMADIVERTEEKVSKITEQEWMAMKDLENSSFQAIIRVYAVLQVNCYYYKPGLMVSMCCVYGLQAIDSCCFLRLDVFCSSQSFPCSRMIELSLEHGLCRDSIVGLVQFASLLCIKSNAYIEPACRIGKAVMNVLSKRFDSPEMVSKLNQYYYGFVGVHIESLESCIENLRKGYKGGFCLSLDACRLHLASVFHHLLISCDQRFSWYVRGRYCGGFPVCTLHRQAWSTERSETASAPRGDRLLPENFA